jgi:PAS domain S-box-containing protein
MRIRTKSAVFLLIIFVIFILGIGFYLKFKESELSALFKEESLDLEHNFDKILELKSKSLYAFVYDYTYWEEMYLFAEAKDGVMKGADGKEYDMYEYGEAYITSESGLDTFKANAAWVYNLDLSVIYWTSNLGDESIKEIPVPIKGAIDKLFSEKENFCKFFIYIPEGLMEIHGAKIMSGSDEGRIGPHAGYFFVGRLWESDTVSELAELTATDLSITREQKKKKSNPGKGIIVFSRILPDWRGKPLACLNVEKVAQVITSYQKTTKTFFFYLIVFSAVILLVLAAFLSHFVSIPMGLISKALKTEDSTPTRTLFNDKSEFSEISRMISMFLEQRNVLISEIKDREEVEKRLRESKKFIENILETAKSVIVVLDKEAKIKSVNRYTEKFLGIDRDQMIGKTWDEVFSFPETREEVKRLFEESLKGHRIVGREISLTTKSGEEKTISWYDSELIDDNGKTQGIVALGYDATQIKKAREIQRLLQLGKLVSDMAHEVNNPLMVISGRAQLLLMEEEWNEDTKKGLNIIFEYCDRARVIIERLLKFSKVSRKDLEDVDLNKSLDFIVKILEHQLSLQDINIERKYDAKPVMVKIDNKQMQEVFMNILKNSAEAMPEGGTITVATSKSDDGAIVEIKDTGKGISEGDMEHIFDPFFTTREMGTGLGLSVSYGIVKLHGGDLKYASTPGKGVTATIFLPLLK